jgi:hypothetical protein
MARRRRRSRQLGLLGVRPVYWWALGGAAVLFLILRRKDVTAAATKAVAVVGDAVFRLALPSAGQPYADDILAVAKETDTPALLIAAFMEQESNYGKALSPPGPAGTGDAGHGRGLMQIDDRGHPDFLAKTDSSGRPLWTIPIENIRYGVKVLKDNLKFFGKTPKKGATVTVKSGDYANKMGVPAGVYPDPRPLTGDALLFASIAGYNTGPGNALKAVAAGLPADKTTSTRKLRDGSVVSYASSVLLRLSDLTSRTA